jgi:hypothetical protein
VAREDDDALLAAAALPPDDRLSAASAAARSRRRWLGQLASESATLAGILLTLAERGDTVTIRSGPWTHEGRLRSVTTALAVMELPSGDVALLPTAAITVVEAAAAVADDRLPGGGPDLGAVLASLVPERPPLRLLLADGMDVAGTLVGLGKDAVVLRLASSVATVRLPPLAGCILPGPGSRPQADGSEGVLASLEDLGSG